MPVGAPAASGGSSLMKSCQLCDGMPEPDHGVRLVLSHLDRHQRGVVHAQQPLQHAALVHDGER